MNREERVVKYINSSDDFVVNDKRYCENDFYNDVEDLAKENQELKEVIDKIKTRYIDYYGTTKEVNDDYVLRSVLKEISNLLKEVE